MYTCRALHRTNHSIRPAHVSGEAQSAPVFGLLPADVFMNCGCSRDRRVHRDSAGKSFTRLSEQRLHEARNPEAADLKRPYVRVYHDEV